MTSRAVCSFPLQRALKRQGSSTCLACAYPQTHLTLAALRSQHRHSSFSSRPRQGGELTRQVGLYGPTATEAQIFIDKAECRSSLYPPRAPRHGVRLCTYRRQCTHTAQTQRVQDSFCIYLSRLAARLIINRFQSA
jgi:hypothetical protein